MIQKIYQTPCMEVVDFMSGQTFLAVSDGGGVDVSPGDWGEGGDFGGEALSLGQHAWEW